MKCKGVWPAVFGMAAMLAAGAYTAAGVSRAAGARSRSRAQQAAPPAVQVQQTGRTAAVWDAQGVKAYQAKDYAGFLADEKRAMALDPGTPRYLYNVACGESLTGNAGEAVRALDLLIARKLDLGAEGDDDFQAIRKTPEWAAFLANLAELRKPLVHSQLAFRLPEPGLVAVGIAVDPHTGDTYIASLRGRKILRRSKTGAVSDFTREAQDGFFGGASLVIDAPRHLLFASTGAVPFMRGYRKEDGGNSGVFAFDLKTGKLARKVLLPPDAKGHFLNAMAVDRAGNVYVSDSLASGIYRLPRGADALETFVAPSVFTAAQGLALSRDEKTLYVVDFSDGLWALDLASKARRHLDGPADVWLGGLDGLARLADGFIAVQIGPRPERVLRLRLDAQWQRVARVEILEMNHPEYQGPIQGVVDGAAFFYVANSQLGLANGQTGAFAEERARPTVVLRLPL